MIKKEHKKGEVKVTFILPKEDVEGKVSVVGDFNAWDPNKNRLVKRSNGTYSVSVKLDEGGHYAFRYFDESGAWRNDETADELELSPFGTQNSVLLT